MTVPAAYPHLVAFVALLGTATPPRPIHVGEVLGAVTVPYWLVLADPGDLDRELLAGSLSRLTMRMGVRSVGSTTEEAVAAVDAARKVLAGAVLTVPGRRCWPIAHAGGGQVRPDPGFTATTTGRRLHIATDVFVISSVPDPDL